MYELLCIFPGTFTEEELKKPKEFLLSELTRFGAEGVVNTSLGKRKLTYPIQNIRYGYYEQYALKLPPEAVRECMRALELSNEILRVLLSKTNERMQKSRTAASVVRAATPLVTQTPASPVALPEQKQEVNLEDLDKKLDELLEGEITV